MFAIPQKRYDGLADALQSIAEANAKCLSTGDNVDDKKGLHHTKAPLLTPELISEKYPLFSTSLFNLIQSTEEKMLGKSKE